MKRHHCWYDGVLGRYVLQGKELHCGDCFQVRDKCYGAWIDVRIEMAGRGSWYLVGVANGVLKTPDAFFEARLYPGSEFV